MQHITIRKAHPTDADLIIEAIIAAEKSNSPLLSYSAIFGMSEEEVEDLLRQALEEEIEGQEICHAHFLIAEVDGRPAAACASWIEGMDGVPSGQIKANVLFHLIGKDKWNAAAEKLKAVAETNIERTAGAAQIESVYTRPEFRGKGLTAMLINEHFKQHKEQNPGLEKAQVILLKNNTSAESAYGKAGFVKTAERTSNHPLAGELLPCPAKIMMEKKL
jgi:ribosomal protein S18 acetylase RimI-like enzyme